MVVADLNEWSQARIPHSLVMLLTQPYQPAFLVDGYPAMQSQMLSRSSSAEAGIWNVPAHPVSNGLSLSPWLHRLMLFPARVLYGLPGTMSAGRRGEVLRHALRSLGTAAPLTNFMPFCRHIQAHQAAGHILRSTGPRTRNSAVRH